MNVLTVRVADASVLLAAGGYGAGALVRYEASTDAGASWSEFATLPLSVGTTRYVVEHLAGTDATRYRSRYSTAAPTLPAHYGGYAVVLSAATLDATVAGATANSYLTVADADAYALADLGTGADKWLAAQAGRRARALMRATIEVDAYLLSSGIARYLATQALLYPRAVDAASGTPYVHVEIRLATYAQARYLNMAAEAIDAAAVRKARAMASASEPNASYAQDQRPGSLLCDDARAYLQGRFARATAVRSVVVGTAYTYPVLGDPGLGALP